ncbi:MFS transporter [Streptomyces sp. MAR4 CNX-425]|uniref:MFS transporter n=1 Tax=Streptomyces sp. MAR4 CNX-425 TaxID=3406343 RepID=UPI003B504085
MATAPASVRPARGTRAALAGVSLAYFMVLLDTTVLAVAEPDLMASLHTGVIGVGWATTTYTMALASALVLGGGLADRFGAGRVFGACCAGFGVVSLGCALAPGLGALLVCRTVLGLLAAGVVPASMAVIAALFPEPGARTRAIGVWASVSGAAMAAGPVLGGWLVELSGWRAVFVVNLPVAAVVLFLCRGRLPVAPHRRPLDPVPHLGLMAALAALTLAVTEAGHGRWGTCLLSAAGAVACAVVTVRVDGRSRAPLVPGPLRRNRPVWAAFGWGAIVNYGLTTVLFAVPLALHEDALGTGLTLLPMTLPIALNPLVTARLAARFGALVPIRLGLGALALGLAGTGAALAGGQQRGVLGCGLFACGLGVSWCLPALVGYAVGHAPARTAGSVGGILNATRQVGATLGAAVAGAALAVRAGSAAEGAAGGAWVAAPFAGACALCAAGLAGALARRGGGSGRDRTRDRERDRTAP